MVARDRTGENWRLSQHLALVFWNRRNASEAHYHARRAMRLSHGHPSARVALARALELQQFPHAVLYQLERLHVSRGFFRGDRTAGERVRAYVASAYVRTYCYLGEVAPARPWIETLRRSRWAEGSAFVQLLHAAFHLPTAPDVALLRVAVDGIARTQPSLTGRAEGKLMRAARVVLLATLAAKAAQ